MTALDLLASGLGAAYALLVGLMVAVQRQLIYPRSPDLPAAPEAALPGVEAVTIPGHDGLALRHWYAPPSPGAGAGSDGGEAGAVVVAFHGNAGTAADRAEKLAPLAIAGLGLLLVEYRGYAGNPGAPAERHLVADGVAAVDWVRDQGIAAARIALYGESLGTGVAVAVAARRQVGAVVLEAPFTSLVAVAQAHYWYLPVYPLLRDRFNSCRNIGRIVAPLLILHGARDPVVPLRQGRRLFAAAAPPKEMVEMPEGGHVDLFARGADTTVLGFLRRWLGTSPPSPAATAPANT